MKPNSIITGMILGMACSLLTACNYTGEVKSAAPQGAAVAAQVPAKSHPVVSPAPAVTPEKKPSRGLSGKGFSTTTVVVAQTGATLTQGLPQSTGERVKPLHRGAPQRLPVTTDLVERLVKQSEARAEEKKVRISQQAIPEN